MEKVRIAFDVGGTFSKGMIFSESGKELLNGIAVYESHSEEAAPFIMNNFLFMISDLCGQLFKEPVVLLSLGLAFPGPFDYEAGVSLIKNLEKFDSLYRVNIKKELMEVLQKSDLTLSENFTIYFENDASCFAMGEYCENAQINGGGYFTIGTGFGSTFIVDHHILKNQYGLPESGMIYNEPFKESVIDDYLSARGLQRIVREVYTYPMDLSVLSERASEGEAKALQVFELFGERIGKAVGPIVKNLPIDELVFGGQISRSFSYFEKGIIHEFTKQEITLTIRSTKDTSLSTIKGLFYISQKKMEEIEK